MKLFYVTVHNNEKAQAISVDLLKKQLAACINWFPVQSAYRWEGEIKQDNEIVLIIKTKENQREKIEEVIKSHITYTNCIAEIDVESVNAPYLAWLNTEVK